MRVACLMLANLTLALLLGVAPVTPARAELYDVQVTHIAQNAYLDQSSRLVIITRLCLQLALGQSAILRYDGRGNANNRLLFDTGGLSNTSCQVAGVYTANASLRRVDQDLYRDLNGGGYVVTQYCYVYVYGEDALVLSDRVLFLDSHEECQLP